jgi:putative ABC transport system permease protein
MRLKDFRVGLRILLADPVYSAVSVLGLGVGLAVCLLLLGFARYSLSYDSQVPDVRNVYVIEARNNTEANARWSEQPPLMLREAARAAPGVILASGFLNWLPLTIQVNGEVRKLQSLTALPGFGELLGLRAIAGDLNEALSRPDTFAITRGAAIRIFGTPNVLGRVLKLTMSSGDEAEDTLPARVGAVLADPPANTTIPFELLTGTNFGLMPPPFRTEALTGAMGWPGNQLIHVRAGASIAAIAAVLQDAIDRSPLAHRLPPQMRAHLGGRKVMDIKLSPLRAAYFDNGVMTNKFSLPVERGNPAVLGGLVAIAALILALAAINYVNLAAIRVIRRQREIAMRKVLGAKGSRLASQFVAESMLVSLLATLIGLLLAWLALPAFSGLMNRDLRSLLSLDNIAGAVAVGLVLGLLISIYPTWVAFGLRPAVMLSGRPDTESLGGRRLRQALSVLQLAAAMALASYTMAIFWQTRFAMNASLGFDPARLLVFDLPIGQNSDIPAARGLIEALEAQPAIRSVAVSGDPVGRESGPWSTEIKREGGQGVTLEVKTVSSDFFGVYGIRPVAGRLFDPDMDTRDSDVLVINAMAARALGFTSPERAVDQTVQFWDQVYGGGSRKMVTRRIVGVAPEIRFYSLREAPRPLAYQLTYGATVTVRASGTITDAERAIRTVWSRYNPNTVLDLSPARDVYAANYAADARLARLLAFSTVIAMIIAAFGTYVLAADAVQRRTGEIALRRLFGASGTDIGGLIAMEVGAIVLVSASVAVPVAAIAIARYLSTFTAHTSIAFWTLAFALGAALAVTTFAAARQAWIAVTLEPAVALRGTE